MQVFCVSFADDYVMHVNLQILKPLGADFDGDRGIVSHYHRNMVMKTLRSKLGKAKALMPIIGIER